MEIQYILNETDYNAFVSKIYKSVRNTWFYIYKALQYFIGILLFLYLLTTPDNIYKTILIYSSIIYLIYAYSLKQKKRKNFSKSKCYRGEIRMVIDEKEIAEYLPNRRTFTSWNCISEITDDETHIYIKLSPYEAYIINKSSIVGATPIEFIEKAKSYFNQFKSNKEESEGHKI